MAEAPREACGLLVGADASIAYQVPTRNADASPTRYSVPAAEHFAAIRIARAAQLEVIGVYHSHPQGPAEPSATDTAEAFPRFLFLIAGLSPAPVLRAWHLVAGNFAELRLVRT